MLGDQQADKHHAPLATMNNTNTILYSYAHILGAGRLTGEYRVDRADALLLF